MQCGGAASLNQPVHCRGLRCIDVEYHVAIAHHDDCAVRITPERDGALARRNRQDARGERRSDFVHVTGACGVGDQALDGGKNCAPRPKERNGNRGTTAYPLP
jgi:hypothetical protein